MHKEDDHMIYLAVERAVQEQVRETLKNEVIQHQIQEAVKHYLTQQVLEDIIDVALREDDCVRDVISSAIQSKLLATLNKGLE
jgi:hypothetical protein